MMNTTNETEDFDFISILETYLNTKTSSKTPIPSFDFL